MEDHDINGDEFTSKTPSFRFKWDVFLSFRGEDTRHTFTDRLYKELVENGVRTFRDDEGLQRGEEIAPSLLEAIQDSAAAIAVISKRYADSRWCLEELATILDCSWRLVLPVFYQVDPSDVRRQGGPFQEDFRRLEERFGEEKVVRWRQAMTKAGGISGWDSRLYGEEQEIIQSLVKKVLNRLSNTPLGVPKYPVGLVSRIAELTRMLDVKANGVRNLGIHGMGGSGKTTLAKALYNKLIIHFKRRSFISNVRETSRQNDGLIKLQNILIRDLSQGAAPEVSRGIISIRGLLHEDLVLIVLDDIDDASQLDALIGKRYWFDEGSRIIITTRDKRAIPEGTVDGFYEMMKLNFPEALQLFSYHAFGRDKPVTQFLHLSEEVVSLTGRLPLALEVFGSSFYDKRTEKDWNDALAKLKQIRTGQLQDVLEISFNGLDEQEKCAFLDIACFFADKEMKREDVLYIFKGSGYSAGTLIRALAAKSLVKIVENDILWMHNQLRDMGRQIVQRENHDLGMRSVLWDHDDIMTVLGSRKGTRSIQGIGLDIEKRQDGSSTKDAYWKNFNRRPNFTSAIMCMKEKCKNHFHHGVQNGKDVMLHTRSFKPMINLRLLQISGIRLDGSFKLMPAELKYLQWKRCPLKTLPSEFCMQHLVVLDLSTSKIRKLWEQSWWNLHTENKRAERLLVMNLQDCYHLTDLPDLTVHSALEKLILERCKALVKIHESVGDLKKLIYLNLKDCSNLVEFPSNVSGLKHLEILILSGCLKLRELPEDMRSMKSLKELLIDATDIVKLPDSIFHLKKLEKFSLKHCKMLKRLPACIGKLNSLKELSLDYSGLEEIPDSIGSLTDLEKLSFMGCRSLTAIPDAISNLKSLIELFLDSTSIQELPTSIGSLSHLKNLSVSHCQSLSRLPDSIGNLASLVGLSLQGTSILEIPDQVGALSILEKLDMGNCMSLRFLPESIGKMLSLTNLVLKSVVITELPESIGMLERLSMLTLNECKQLRRLLASIGNLKSLCYFYMAETSIIELPDEIGMLSSLVVLKMRKQPHAQQPQNTVEHMKATTSNAQENLKSSVLPESLSNLSLLRELDACAWKFSGPIPDEFEKLSSLEILTLSHNNFCSLPSSLRGLSILKNLFLDHCKELKSLPLLPSSLLRLNISNCSSLESICDLTNLKSLLDLNLTNCNKIRDIPGIQHLKSLRRLHMSGCNTCFSAVKERLAKVALKHLFNLSVPGSILPDWFVQQIPRFSNPRNREIKGIIIGVVVSLDQQARDSFRDKLPATVDIQAKIFRLDDPKPIHYTTLKLIGVPDTNEDQLYLCRYQEFHGLVFMLKEGDKIQIAMRETPYFNGLILKKYGIHLIFEYDDDNDDDDEESLDESQQSVSWKLAKFIGSL